MTRHSWAIKVRLPDGSIYLSDTPFPSAAARERGEPVTRREVRSKDGRAMLEARRMVKLAGGPGPFSPACAIEDYKTFAWCAEA
jgi:hypothetical protein